MGTKNGKVVTYRERLSPINSQNSCGHVRSREKLKAYFHYHNVYGYQICQGGDIPQGAPTHKFA